MKVNCKAVKISLWISIITLIVAIFFKIMDVKYASEFTSFMKDLGLGVFCSSIVTVFFYISAYHVERKKVLEQFWHEARKMIIELKKIDYMNIDFEQDIFVKFINEQTNKLWVEEYYKQIEKEIPEKEYESTNLIKNEIIKRDRELFEELSKDTCEKYLKERIEKLYDKTTKNIDKIIDQYLDYLKYSSDNLNFILGDIEFFTGKNNYIKVYEIFEKIYNLRVKIQESARHFRYYKNGEGKKAIALLEILELQKNIFKVEETNDSKIVYGEFVDMMELKLEELRADIIYNINREKIEIVPLMEIVNTSNNNEAKN